MSTRSIIALPYDDDVTRWAGRYCHSDGYPTNMAKELLKIIKRDGIEVARRVLTVEHFGWSYIAYDNEVTEDKTATASPRGDLAGYGMFYENSHPADWQRNDESIGDLEWAYVLRDDRLSVYSPESTPLKAGVWTLRGELLYADEISDEQLGKVECGEQYERCGHYAWVHFPEELPTTSRISMTKYLAGDFTED